MLKIDPGIVWAVDLASRERSKAWYATLDETARQFIVVAESWEQVRDAVAVFNTVSFGTQMMHWGLTPNPAGRLVNVVLIGYAMGSEAYSAWATDLSRLESIARDVLSIDCRAVLLGDNEQHLPQERKIRADGLSIPTWVVTNKGSTRETLSGSDHQALVNTTLDCLLLAERYPAEDIERSTTFYSTHVQPGHGALVGVPVLALPSLLDAFVFELLGRVGTLARDPLAFEYPEAEQVEERLWKRHSAFVGGDIRAEQYLDAVLRRDLPDDITFEFLTNGVATLLQQFAEALAREIPFAANPETGVPFTERASLWRRLLGRWSGAGSPRPTTSRRLRQDDARFAHAALLRAIEHLREVTSGVERWTAIMRENELSRSVVSEQCRRLALATRAGLRRAGAAPLVLTDVESRCRAFAMENCRTWLEQYGDPGSISTTVRQRIHDGTLLRLSAATVANSCRCTAAVTNIGFPRTIRHGGNEVTVTRLPFWPDRPPLLLAVTEPIAFDQIQG